MLERFRLLNFQSHKDTGDIVLHPNVNVFTGPSDNGKSALVRGLDFLCRNQPSGTEFVSDWLRKGKASFTGNTNVTGTFDGKDIVRTRGKENRYIVDGKELEAFGTTVPEEVTDLTRLHDVNIQQQHQTFYLLDKPSGEVAKEINDMVNMEIIDISMTNIEKKVRSIKAEQKATTKVLKEWNTSADEFRFLDDVKPTLEKCEALEERKTALETKMTRLTALSASLRDLGHKRDQYEDIKRQHKLTERVREIEVKKDDINKKVITLQNYQSAFKDINNMKEIYESKASFADKISNVQNLKLKLDALTLKRANLVKIHKELLDIHQVIRDNKASIRNQKQQQKDLGLVNCPVCGAEIKGD